jgi:hypothetical protein
MVGDKRNWLRVVSVFIGIGVGMIGDEWNLLRAMSLVSVGGGMIDGHVICKCYGLW